MAHISIRAIASENVTSPETNKGDILLFIDQLAAKARAKDKESGFNIGMTSKESNQRFRDVWAQQKNKPGLPYHHPDQELDWLCVACNRLRDEFSAREVLNVFTKIHAAAQKTPVPRQPTQIEIERIKKMRGDNYSSEDNKIKKTVVRNNWSLSSTANTTATSADLIAIAKKAGCIGMHSK
ncbi:hypothetical protein HK100_012116 [Physocladia obscura]|uniref:Uncharacterized protein n=1 Tax=Physocladia obscura TaxID=109957 RepID=A0AAD5T0U9_9FUNG|nr:hypothetical protein HK100_012116 [Physocladia obscura]